MKLFTATANADGVRLSRFVQRVTRDFPTSLLYKSFRNKRVKVNGKKAVPEYRSLLTLRHDSGGEQRLTVTPVDAR